MKTHPLGSVANYSQFLATVLQSSLKTFILSLIVLSFLTSCTQIQKDTPTLTPTTEPNSQLKLADNFVSGLSQVPPDHYLFVEVTINTNCSGCDCAVIELPPDSYSWYGKNHARSGGILIKVFQFGEEGIDLWKTDENWRLSDLQPSPLGFLGFGQYPQGLEAIIELPISTPDKQITLHSIDSQGNIVAEIDGIDMVQNGENHLYSCCRGGMARIGLV